MKKRNNKGFFLVETLIVTTIVALAMVFLYTQIVKLIDGYELRLTYNTVDGTYGAVEFNKYILNDSAMYSYYTNSANITSNGYVNVACANFTSPSYCSAMYSTLGVNRMIVTTYNTAAIKTAAPTIDDFSDDLKLFISNIKGVNNAPATKYRLIIEYTNGTYATVALNSGTDKTAPTIAGDQTLYITSGESYNPSDGLVATDNIYGDISSNIVCTLISGSNYICTVTDSSGNISANFYRTVLIKYQLDITGAAIPQLASNMVPVYYDSTAGVWKKADIYNANSSYQWYNYANKMWANAVTVTSTNRSTYQNAAAGTTIATADILTYMVWVPRYKYLIPSGTGARTITIVFESATTSKSTGDAITTYKTHPAFTFGTQELSGIWVSKYPTTGSITGLTSLPGVAAYASSSVSQFETAIMNMTAGGNTYGYVSGEVDTHMILNTEWGAVTYLAYSIYGKNSEVWINPNAGMLTGQAGTSVSAATTTSTYGFNNTTYGVNASTTGNVNGIYDMSGCAWEYTMGNYNNYSGYSSSSNSGYNGYNGYDGTTTVGIAFPTSKYYNLYTTTTAATACSGGICYGQALSETAGWNSDYSSFIYGTYPWMTRSGGYNGTTGAGMFSYYNGNAGGAAGYSTRIVVTKQ